MYVINSTNTGIPEIRGMPFSKKIWYIIIKEIEIQIKFAVFLFRILNRIDVVVFFIGGNTLLLPMIISRLLHKKTILIVTGSPSKVVITKSQLASQYYKFLENACYTLTNVIVVYTKSVVTDYRLEKFREKICFAARNVDLTLFKESIPLSRRQNVIGFIGRFAPEKGIMNLVKSIPLIESNLPNKDLRFVMIGHGRLKNQMQNKLKTFHSSNDIKLLGWIPHEKLPFFLNNMKFLVCPSYTEGLPNVALEAMACGTIVLASPVGGIPDVVKDSQTGFLMRNNDPDQIASTLIRAIKCENLDEISERAKEFIRKEFSFRTALKRYRAIFEMLEK